MYEQVHAFEQRSVCNLTIPLVLIPSSKWQSRQNNKYGIYNCFTRRLSFIHSYICHVLQILHIPAARRTPFVPHNKKWNEVKTEIVVCCRKSDDASDLVGLKEYSWSGNTCNAIFGQTAVNLPVDE